MLLLVFLDNVFGLFAHRLNLEADLETWPRLKRRAGYFTSSYRYRGGLYKRARNEALEFYECIKANRKYCVLWTAKESDVDEPESVSCACTEEGTLYCASWTCEQKRIEVSSSHCKSGQCRNEVHIASKTCSCDAESKNGRYCKRWSCSEIGSDGTVEDEIHHCLVEDDTLRYCSRWKGDVYSKKEIEASVCECDRRGDKYCINWICKERGITRCNAYGSGWCNFELAVGLAGGLGTFFILAGLLMALRFSEDPMERLPVFCLTIAIFCLPWTAAVAIWGGIRALVWVAGMWGIAFISCICLLSLRYYPQSSSITYPTSSVAAGLCSKLKAMQVNGIKHRILWRSEVQCLILFHLNAK